MTENDKLQGLVLNDLISASRAALSLYDESIRIYETLHFLFLDENFMVVKGFECTQKLEDSVVFNLANAYPFIRSGKAKHTIMIHNHPSGNPNPSNADKSANGRLKDAFYKVNINFLDSLILTDTWFYTLSKDELFHF